MPKLETDIGRLNKRITIQKASTTEQFDTIGNQLPGWTDYHSCWAAVTGDSDKESYAAKEPRDKAIKNFKVRYCSKLEDMTTDSYRIKYRGHYYNIVSIDNLAEADSLLIIKAQREEDHERDHYPG